MNAPSLIAGLVVAAMVTLPAASAEKAKAKPGHPPIAQTAPAEPGPRFTPREKPTVAYGEKVFLEYCAVCHGLHGKGDGPRSAFFAQDQYIPDLTTEGFLAGRDQELKDNIRSGLARFDEPALVMPQFKYILGTNEIEAVVSYIKTLK